MIPPELSAAIEAQIAYWLPRSAWNHTLALATPRSLFIHGTSAMYEYYLAPDGTVYEKDLDSSRTPERVESASRVRETYVHAAAKYPELAALALIDPAAPPSTFADALRYPARVIAAWDDSDPTARTLVAFAVGQHGARRLAARQVDADERDALLDALGRDHPIGATLGHLVWHVDLVSGFAVHDATSLRVDYIHAWDTLAVRSSRAVEVTEPDGTIRRIVDDVEPEVASRLGRDLANFVGGSHDDNGTPNANTAELAIVRACRELARRIEEVPGYKVQRELRVSAGPIGGATDVAVRIDDARLAVEIATAAGARVTVPLRAVARDAWFHFKLHLDRPWIVRDILRAIAEHA